MKPIKEKPCSLSSCGKPFTQFKSTDKYCSPDHYYEDKRLKDKSNCPDKKNDKKLKPIAKFSPKMIKELAKYRKLRKEFLAENPFCEVYPELRATEVHHTYSGKDRAVHFLEVDTWLSVSRKGHNWIHAHPKEARELGLLK